MLEGIGWLRISSVDGSLDTGLYTWSDPVPAPKLLGIENEMSEVVDGAQKALGEWLDTKVGVSTAEQTIYDPEALDDYGKPLLIVRVSETNLGDLVTDAFRAQSGADVAIDCAGSIRTNLPKGDITISNILPVASKYEAVLLDKAFKMKELGLNYDSDVALLRDIQSRVATLQRLVADMIEARKVANRIEDQREKAIKYHDTVAIYFDEIRSHIDRMEEVIDDELWPLPKYRELMFIR
jgi:hypothetical protein